MVAVCHVFFRQLDCAAEVPYEGLQPSKVYQAHVVFNSMPEPAKTKATNVSGVSAHGQGGDRMRLVAAAGEGGKAATVWPPPPQEYSLPPSPMAKTVVSIPHALTRGGSEGSL